MANVTIKINRSDRFPIGTVVAVYPSRALARGGTKPAGSPLSEATVAADGSLTFSVPTGTAWVLFAEVASEGRALRGGDPTPDLVLPTLRERRARRRALAGV